jgi:hypothetical protein
VKAVTDSVSLFTGPKSVVTRYEFEDKNTTGTAADSVGNNDASINGASYTTTSKVGNNALSFDGSNDELNSNSAVDLVADGSTDAMSIMGWVFPRDTNQRSPIGWWSDNENILYVFNDSSGNWQLIIEVDDSGVSKVGPAITTNAWVHVYIELTQSEANLKLDGNTNITITHNQDITNLGAMTLRVGHDPFRNHSNAIIDDFHAANDTLSNSALQSIRDRGN